MKHSVPVDMFSVAGNFQALNFNIVFPFKFRVYAE